jgi:hypothetical protein
VFSESKNLWGNKLGIDLESWNSTGMIKESIGATHHIYNQTKHRWQHIVPNNCLLFSGFSSKTVKKELNPKPRFTSSSNQTLRTDFKIALHFCTKNLSEGQINFHSVIHDNIPFLEIMKKYPVFKLLTPFSQANSILYHLAFTSLIYYSLLQVSKHMFSINWPIWKLW